MVNHMKGGYMPPIRRFQPRDHLYLQQNAPTTMDVIMGPIILQSTCGPEAQSADVGGMRWGNLE
jgi:hypothetical protein